MRLTAEAQRSRRIEFAKLFSYELKEIG